MYAGVGRRCQCWENMVLVDFLHFPLWEKGVFDCL